MLLPILAALCLLIYGTYRAARRWGSAALWYGGAVASALNASGVVAERLWGPRYSGNFTHYPWHSLPATPMGSVSASQWRFRPATVRRRARTDGPSGCAV